MIVGQFFSRSAMKTLSYIFLALTLSMSVNLNAKSSFIGAFQKAILESVHNDKELQKVEGLDTEKVCQFITTLCEEGYAEIRGTDQQCRSICVTAQGAIEDALTQMLLLEEIFSVEALFFTPLPTTPLRKKGRTEGLSSVPFEPARQYTLNMREHTLRSLRDAGATVIAAYSKDAYNTLKAKNDEGSLEQVENWEKESAHPQVMDFPIEEKIPQELVGALYIITDNQGNQFYLPTQGIQAKDAAEGQSIWKKWLTTVHAENEGTDRANKIFDYLEKNSF